MRSLRYILGGCPRTLDDCLDLAHGSPPLSVTLDLATNEFALDICAVRQFIGHYHWQFPARAVRCTEVYGELRLPAGHPDERSAANAANAELNSRLAALDALGITVAGSDKRFARSGADRADMSIPRQGHK